jgi:hypothetical protein
MSSLDGIVLLPFLRQEAVFWFVWSLLVVLGLGTELMGVILVVWEGGRGLEASFSCVFYWLSSSEVGLGWSYEIAFVPVGIVYQAERMLGLSAQARALLACGGSSGNNSAGILKTGLVYRGEKGLEVRSDLKEGSFSVLGLERSGSGRH